MSARQQTTAQLSWETLFTRVSATSSSSSRNFHNTTDVKQNLELGLVVNPFLFHQGYVSPSLLSKHKRNVPVFEFDPVDFIHKRNSKTCAFSNYPLVGLILFLINLSQT